MKIGIDARYWGNKHTGIGRYVQNLVLNLAEIDTINQYVVFGGDELRLAISQFPNFKWVQLTTRPYSILEQIINPIIFMRQKLDLLHVPHFNAPILYFGKYILTIHDLIKHLSIGRATTTLPYPVYLVKHLVYRLSVRLNLLRSDQIIVPANYWKEYLVNNFALSKNKIHVTYEAVPKLFSQKTKLKKSEVLNKYGLNQPYIVYTGNLYPHKNVPFLVEAVRQFNACHEHQLELAIACARDAVFKNSIKPEPVIKYLGYVPDEELMVLFQGALALVQPSLIEGFGLTGLEAMSVGLPVLSSNATCLPEIYKDAALYFNPRNLVELVRQLDNIFSNHAIAQRLILAGRKRIKYFNFSKMSRQTLAVYKLAASKSELS